MGVINFGHLEGGSGLIDAIHLLVMLDGFVSLSKGKSVAARVSIYVYNRA